MTHVYAFTPPGAGYPPYINISRNDEGDYVVTVRGPAITHPTTGFAVPGPTAQITLPPAELAAMADASMHT